MSTLTKHLRDREIPHEILFHQQTFHARDEAHRLGIPVSEVVKTILIETRCGQVLAVILASRRLDLRRVRVAIGDPHARLATEEEIQHRFPTYELGALPPLASVLGIQMLVDPEVLDGTGIVFAVSSAESIRVPTAELFCGEQFRVVSLIERQGEPEVAPSGELVTNVR